MLLTASDGASVELRPARYQFATVRDQPPAAGGWDANWLQVRGAVRTAAGESWTFEQPCLTTWEAQELGDWLRAVAEGRVAVTDAPTDDSEDLLTFTEPNLGFGLASRGDDSLVVRVHLSHESAPGWPWADAFAEGGASWGSHAVSVPLRVGREDVRTAARTWADDLAPFPRR